MRWSSLISVMFLSALTVAVPVMAAGLTREDPGAAKAAPIATAPEKAVGATNLENKTYTILQLSGVSGFFLRGSNASREFYIPVLRQWDLDSVVLHLDIYKAAFFSKSTTLTLYANNQPIDSIEMTGSIVSKKWDIKLPSSFVKNNLIGVMISSVVNDVGFSCYNLINPSYWIYVSGGSTVNYIYKNQNYYPDLSLFPFPFIHDPSLTEDTVLVALPDKPSLKNMASAFNVANMLGEKATWRGVKLMNAAVSSMTDAQKSNSNIILIGTAKELGLNSIGKSWPLPVDENGQLLDKDKHVIDPDVGVLMLSTSPFNPKNALLAVTGNSDEGVNKAALMLRDPDFSNSILFNQHALVTDTPDIESSMPNWEDTTLKILGYSNQTIYAGAGNTLIDTDIVLPQNKKLKGLKLNIKYLISPYFTKLDKPYLTIRVNGIPVGGTPLAGKGSAIKSWEFNIDGANLLPGKNRITFDFNIRLNTQDCNPQTLNLAWVTFYSDTQLHLDLGDADTFLTFQTFTSADGDLAVLLPASQSFFRSTDFLQSVLDLGKLMQRVRYVDFVDSETFTVDQVTGRNIIYIGNLNATAINSYKSKIPFYFDSGKLQIDPSLIPVLSISTETPVAVTEIVPSIFDPNFLMMLVNGRDEQGYLLGIDLISDVKKNGLINGNVVLSYENGSFNSLQSQKLAIRASERRRVNKVVDYVVMGIKAFLIALVLFVVGIIVRRIYNYYFSKNPDKR